MSLVQFLFGFQGRVRRLHFWLFYLALSVVFGGLMWQFGHWTVMHNGTMMSGGDWPESDWHSRMGGIYVVTHNPFIGLFSLAAFWMKIAVTVKRWHDRDKSGWMYLILLIPLIGWIWTLIECGFLDGTPGPNRYGPSPKGIDAPEKSF
ncbi:MAG: DUF805 domain-containing protein [Asticcacaulis sp.]